MAVFAVNILGSSDEPTGRAEVMVAEDELTLHREFGSFLTAASEVVITDDPERVEAELLANGWAPPAITEGERTRLYRCRALPDNNLPDHAPIPVSASSTDARGLLELLDEPLERGGDIGEPVMRRLALDGGEKVALPMPDLCQQRTALEPRERPLLLARVG